MYREKIFIAKTRREIRVVEEKDCFPPEILAGTMREYSHHTVDVALKKYIKEYEPPIDFYITIDLADFLMEGHIYHIYSLFGNP